MAVAQAVLILLREKEEVTELTIGSAFYFPALFSQAIIIYR